MRNVRIVWWDGHKGSVHYDEVWATLRSPPRLHLLTIEQLDYMPTAGLLWVKEMGKEWRALTATEQTELDEILNNMAHGLRAVVC